MATEVDRERGARIAFAALAAAVVGPLAYVAQRLADYAIGGEMDPLAMLATTTVAFYWRCAVAAFWAVLAAIAALFVARRVAFERAAVPVAIAASVVAGLYAGLTWLYP